MQSESLSEKYKTHSFQGQSINQDTIQQMLEELPPQRATALMTALVDLSNIVPKDMQEVERLTAKAENDFKRIENIRTNLHFVLGDDTV